MDGYTLMENPFDSKDTVKVMIGEPSSGLIDCQAHDNRLDFVMELARLESRSNLKFFTGNVGRMGINYAREMMAQEACRQNLDYLFMIDDDMIVPKTCFERVYNALKRECADMAAPLCTQRVHPFRPVLYRHAWVDKSLGVKQIKNETIDDYEPDSTVQVDGVGFGVVLISVPLLKKMYSFLPPGKGLFFSNCDTGEDIWFCINARQQFGAKIVVDTSIKIGHLKWPEAVTELDWVKATGKEEKFKSIYGPDAPRPNIVWESGPKDMPGYRTLSDKEVCKDLLVSEKK